jgi:hypothetical protein
MSEIVALHRTLEQELTALLRGASMECLVCGEFVMRRGPALACPECGCVIRGEAASAVERRQEESLSAG